MKTITILCTSLILIACVREVTEEFMNSTSTSERPADVLTNNGIDSVLALLDEVQYSELNEKYLNYSHPKRKFTTELKNRQYFSVRGDQLHYKVVGNFRIKDFIAKDEYYHAYKDCPAADFTQFWLVDKKVLYMMLELINALKEEGYNEYGFHIRNQHRHPKKNSDINGASYSQHMFGKAIDIGIDDIDNNGVENQADKTVVYKMLQEIVGNRGGLGKYPGSMNLHFDVRGFRARWDVP